MELIIGFLKDFVLGFRDLISSPKLSFFTLILTLLLLLLPPMVLSWLGITQVVMIFKSYIGFGLLVSLVSLISQAIWWFPIQTVLTNFKQWLLVQKTKGSFSNLTIKEKKILKQFIIGDATTVSLSIQGGEYGTLECLGMISRVTSFGMGTASGGINLPFAMQPWCRVYLKKNTFLLNE